MVWVTPSLEERIVHDQSCIEAVLLREGQGHEVLATPVPAGLDHSSIGGSHANGYGGVDSLRVHS